MACQRYYELISQRLDGELSQEEERELESHLRICPGCRALAEQLSGLHEEFSTLEEVPAPEGFARGVMNRIQAEDRKKVVPLFKRPQFKAAAGLAACLILCAGLYGSGQLDWSGQTTAAQSKDRAETAKSQAETVQLQGDGSQENADASAGTDEAAPGVYGYSFASGEGADGGDAQAGESTPRVYGSELPSKIQSRTEPEESDSLEGTVQSENGAENGLTAEANQSSQAPNMVQDDLGAVNGLTGMAEANLEQTLPFENEQSFSVTLDSAHQVPSAVILGNVQSMKAYLDSFPDDDLSAVAETYDEAYFEQGRLLAVLAESGSSSDPVVLMENGLTAEQVVLTENTSEEGGEDVSAWLILAEVGTEFDDGDELEVSIVHP